MVILKNDDIDDIIFLYKACLLVKQVYLYMDDPDKDKIIAKADYLMNNFKQEYPIEIEEIAKSISL